MSRRIRTGVISEMVTYRSATRNGVRGVAVIHTGKYLAELRERNAPRMIINARTGEIRWQGERVAP